MKQAEMIHQYNEINRPKFNQELFVMMMILLMQYETLCIVRSETLHL